MAVPTERAMDQLNQCTNTDTNKVTDLHTGDNCPIVTQIKIAASEEVMAAEICSAHAWGATGSCLSAECAFWSKAEALQEQVNLWRPTHFLNNIIFERFVSFQIERLRKMRD